MEIPEQIPDPVCDHKTAGRVTAGDLQAAHASTYVCSRPGCIEDAMLWARSLTGLEAVYVPFNPRGV